MRIEAQGIAKRYRREWIVRNVQLELQPGNAYAVTGPNGAGKSTLLRLLSGHLTPSKGSLVFWEDEKAVPIGEAYRQLSYAAPYVELIEELTLREALRFHTQFQPFVHSLQAGDLLDLLAFPRAENKQIRHFSSGMKQRLKLALALCSDTSVVLLDEPTTNLDRQGVDWYLRLIERFGAGRLLIVASNVEEDYGFCQHHIDIMQYKRG
ncbi:MAG: ABC transporter ATP-binding protein [Saprospiraceae bacterium]|nr:ABC transporter ATP-binding protein [Saprospiraceae bacterium]